MSFMLGSFTSGLFGGAGSMLQLAGAYQTFQDRKAQIDAADEWKKTRDAQTSLDKANNASDPTISGTVDYSQPQQQTPPAAPAPTNTNITQTTPKPAEAGDTKLEDKYLDTGSWDPQAARTQTEAVVNPAMSPIQKGVGVPVAPIQTAPPNLRTFDQSPDAQISGQVGAPQAPPPVDLQTPSQMIGAPQPPPPLTMPGTSALQRPTSITNKPVGSTITSPFGQRAAQPAPTPPAPTPPAPAETGANPNQPMNLLTNPPAPKPAGNALSQGFQDLFGIKSAQAGTTGYGSNVPPGGAGAPAGGLQTSAQDFSPETSVTPAPQPQGGLVQAASTERGVNPAQDRAQQATERPAPGGGPTAVAAPATVAPVAPGQTSPTIQSQPTPPIIKAAVPTNAYNGLAPDIRKEVDQAAQELHVSPYRLAVVGKYESGFKPNAANPNSSARGVGQFLTGTRAQMEQPQYGGKLGDSRAEQIRLTARYIDYNDRIFGKDSAGSFMGYHAGPGVASQFATNFDAMAKAHPEQLAFVEKEMGRKLTQADFTKGDLPDARQLVAAASQGPNQFLQFISQTGNPGMQMYDRWQQAETSLVYAALRRGDYAGAAHARDMVFQMSHQGMFENTMQAHAQLQAGDTYGAAKSLAKANAFFPDGAMGQFGVDGTGNLWAQRVDEHDPSKKLGPAFQVTPDKLTNLLAMTRDPKDYMKFVQDQQKSNETMRHNKAEEGIQMEGHAVTLEGHRQASLDRQERQKETADYHEAQLAAQGAKSEGAVNQATVRQNNQMIRDFYGPKATPMQADGVTPMDEQQKGLASQAFSDIFTSAGGKVTGAEAQRRANGIIHGTMVMQPTNTPGYYAVVEKGTTMPLGYISAETHDMIKGALVPGATGKKPNAPTSAATH